MKTYDIAIVGGGIAGLSLAYFLGDKRSTVVLEREPNLGYHSTGRSAAEFVMRYNAPPVSRMAAISQGFLAAPPPGFAETAILKQRGNILIADTEKAEALVATYDRLAPEAPEIRMLSVDEAVEMAPILDGDFVKGAFYDPAFWDIEVETLLQGYARGARRAGVEILSDAGVVAARDTGTHWEIDTANGPVRAQILVNAAGGWADTLATLCGVAPVGIVPHRRTAILVDLPAGINSAIMPGIAELDDVYYFKPDAGRLMVSPADETPCEPADMQPEEIDIAWAAHYLEQATTLSVTRVAKSWAGMRSFSPDRLPVIGAAKDNPRFFWLAGQGGYGILTSPALGALAAALLTASEWPRGFGRGGLDPALFSPARF